MNILVVDDSKIIRIMIMRILNELGYDTITEAVDVDSAMLKIQSQKPDLILSDYNMPGKNGVDFLRMVRENPATKTVPFMLITTVHDKKIIVEAVKAGLQFFILKPIEKSVLAEKLSSLAENYFFQPPRTTSKPFTSGISGSVENNPTLSAHLPLEKIDAILDHFFLVFDGEMSIPDFLSWVGENISATLPQESDFHDPQKLLDRLRDTAHHGMFTELKKYST